jgi:hypothetical protein
MFCVGEAARKLVKVLVKTPATLSTLVSGSLPLKTLAAGRSIACHGDAPVGACGAGGRAGQGLGAPLGSLHPTWSRSESQSSKAPVGGRRAARRRLRWRAACARLRSSTVRWAGVRPSSGGGARRAPQFCGQSRAQLHQGAKRGAVGQLEGRRAPATPGARRLAAQRPRPATHGPVRAYHSFFPTLPGVAAAAGGGG